MRIARLRAFALGVGLFLTALSTGRAADQTMTLALGSGSVFTLERPFDTVLIDHADVVDIRCQGSRSVILKALNPGTVNVVFVDAQSVAIANVRIVVRDAQI
jgi:Flp pilus assembly secretin CpaC